VSVAMRIRLLFLLAVVAVALVVVSGASAAGRDMAKSGNDSVGFGVSPMRFDTDVSPGSSKSEQITISNTDDVAMTYTFSKEDFQGDKDDPAATPVLLGGEFKSGISGYDWISLPDSVTVPAGGSKTVNVRVTAPSGATGGHYAALIVSGASRSANDLVATSRIGVLFMMNAGGVPPPDIVITEIQEVGPTKTVTKFTNDGKVAIHNPGGTITQDPLGPGHKRIIKGTCTKDVLPGAAGTCTFDTGPNGGGSRGDGTLPVGPYHQSLDLIGDDSKTSARGDLPTQWAGTWTSMLLPIVGIALFALYFLFLRRRRKDNEGGDDGDLAYDGSSFS
jgi:LPXTG-motif cell wall-anchored protein